MFRVWDLGFFGLAGCRQFVHVQPGVHLDSLLLVNALFAITIIPETLSPEPCRAWGLGFKVTCRF